MEPLVNCNFFDKPLSKRKAQNYFEKLRKVLKEDAWNINPYTRSPLHILMASMVKNNKICR